MSRLLLASPVGPLLAEYDARALRALRFWPQGEHPPAGTRDAPARDDALGRRVAAELREYFAGERRDFSLPLDLPGTAFQRGVWEALRAIPFGETRSYGDLARALGKPGASRAVGQANARNPVPIVVPCHRVLASDGGLGGYLGAWGESSATSTKRWLLDHEQVSR
jgi:methylated-DNA-[protein]-cysteine S-methyltransferase